MLAAHNAYSDRANALLTVQTLLSEISSLQSRAEKLESASSRVFGGDKTRNYKLEELKETLKITEDSKNCAVREYEKIKVRNPTEIFSGLKVKLKLKFLFELVLHATQ